MSESEQMGRCRMEITAAYKRTSFRPKASDLLIADAIDRLAADVAAIRAKVDAISDVAHLLEGDKAWVTLVEEQRDAAIRERDQWREEARLAVINRDEARAEVERLNAELAARPAAPAAGWLTQKELRVLADHAQALREQRFALERGGLSSGYSMNPGDLKHQADAINAIIARAGLPPVVEVPAMVFGGGSYQMEKRYRAAMDRAGVQWKEVGRE